MRIGEGVSTGTVRGQFSIVLGHVLVDKRRGLLVHPMAMAAGKAGQSGYGFLCWKIMIVGKAAAGANSL